MIEFLQDYTTEALPPEHFKKGEQVERSETSERYFVGRGLAGYLVDGKLVDLDHRPIVSSVVAVEVVQPGDRRLDLAVRAGEVMTGQPPRASSGPGVPFVEAATGPEGTPPVVLEAEVERLKEALTISEGLFRDMNNSHVETNEKLRGEIDLLTNERDDARAKLDAERGQVGSIGEERDTLRAELDARAARIAELEGQIEAASAAAKQTKSK